MRELRDSGIPGRRQHHCLGDLRCYLLEPGAGLFLLVRAALRLRLACQAVVGSLRELRQRRQHIPSRPKPIIDHREFRFSTEFAEPAAPSDGEKTSN